MAMIACEECKETRSRMQRHDGRIVCDECYEKETGDVAVCADDCSLPLDHTGLCLPEERDPPEDTPDTVQSALEGVEELLAYTHGLANCNWEDVNQSAGLRDTLRRNTKQAHAKLNLARRLMGLPETKASW